MNHLFRTQLLVSNSLRRLPIMNSSRLMAMGLRRGEQTDRPIEKKTRNESDIRMDDQPPLHPSSYGKQQQEHHTATEKLKNWFENVMGVSNEEAMVRNDLNSPLERDQNRNRTNMSSTTTSSKQTMDEAERYKQDLNRLDADIENKVEAFPEGQTTIPVHESESESKIKEKPWESVNQPDKMKNKAWSTGGADVIKEDRVWSAGGVEAQKVIKPESNFSKDSKDSLWKESAQQGRENHKPWTTTESAYPKEERQSQDMSSKNKGSDFVVDQDGHAKENVRENQQRSHKVQ